jgi:hypothetical protein
MAAKNNPSGFSAVLHCTICATLIKPTHILSKVQGPDENKGSKIYGYNT